MISCVWFLLTNDLCMDTLLVFYICDWSIQLVHDTQKAILALSILALAMGSQEASAGSVASGTNGDWGSGSTWVPAGVPTIGDDVTVNKAVTVQAGAAAVGNILYVNGTTGDLTVALLATLSIADQTTLGYFTAGKITNQGTFTSAGMDIYGSGTFINGLAGTLSIGSTGLTVARGGTLSLAVGNSASASTLDPQAPDPDNLLSVVPSVLRITGTATGGTLISYGSLKGTSGVFGTVYYNDTLVPDPTTGGIDGYRLVYGTTALSLAAVPEPMMMGTLGMAASCLLMRRRRA